MSTPSKWPGSHPALERVADLPGRDAHLRAAVRQQLARVRREQEVGAGLVEQGEIRVQVARVAGEVLLRPELQRVHEERDDDEVGHLPRPRDERQVPVVQRAHRRHERDPTSCGPRCGDLRAHLRDGRDRRRHASSSLLPGRRALQQRPLERGSGDRPEHRVRVLDPEPHQPGSGRRQRALDRPDRVVERRGPRGPVVLVDDDRLAAHLHRERLPDRQHRGRRGHRAARLPQPDEVDAGAGERHRGRQRDRDRPAADGREQDAGAEAGRRVHDELPRDPDVRLRESLDQRGQLRRPGTASSTSSLRSTSSGIVSTGTPGSIASARSRLSCDTAVMPTSAWPAPASAAPSTGPTRPAPITPTPSRPAGLMGAPRGRASGGTRRR